MFYFVKKKRKQKICEDGLIDIWKNKKEKSESSRKKDKEEVVIQELVR